MPNWCNNSLIIEGEDTTINELLKNANDEESNFSLEKLVPTPAEEKDNWYSWRLANWGTKWNLGKVDFEQGEGYVSFNFETAWAPPVEALATISKNYPDLSFDLTYDEPGADYCGKATFQDGMQSDQQYSYSENFNSQLNFSMEEAKFENGQFIVPILFSKKEDPYEFESEPIKVSGTLTFKENIEPNDFEESITNGDFEFSFIGENADFAKNSLENEDTYSFASDLENKFEEIKKQARYNSLKKEVKPNGNKPKRKKI